MTIEAGFLLITAIFAYVGRRDLVGILEWIAVVGGSVLAHELGHAVAYRRFGARARIVLSSIFGLTYGEALPPGRRIAVALAGPFTGFVLGGLILAVAVIVRPADPGLRLVLGDLVWINLAWGAINLLPILPLDGGNAMAAILERLGRRNATREALVVSLATALLASVAAVAVGQPWLLILLVFFAVANYDQFRSLADVGRRGEVSAAATRVLQGQHDAGIAELEAIERSARSGAFRQDVARILAWSLLAAGRLDGARAVISRAEPGHADDVLGTLVELADGAPPDRLVGALRGWTSILAQVAAARVITDAGRLDEVLAEATRLEPSGPSRVLAALQVGLAAADLDAEFDACRPVDRVPRRHAVVGLVPGADPDRPAGEARRGCRPPRTGASGRWTCSMPNPTSASCDPIRYSELSGRGSPPTPRPGTRHPPSPTSADARPPPPRRETGDANRPRRPSDRPMNQDARHRRRTGIGWLDTAVDRLFPEGALLLSVLTFGSYLVGLARDRVQARTFGAGAELDAYNAAFQIPEVALGVLVGSGLAAPFIPIFLGLRQEDESAARAFAGTILTLATLIILVATPVLFVLAPQTVDWVAPGFDAERRALYVELFRLMLITPLLFAISDVLGEILVAERRFVWYALAPIVYNAGLAAGTILLAPRIGIFGPAVGAILGAALHLGVRAWGMRRSTVRLGPAFALRTAAMRRFGLLMLPKMASHPIEPLTFLQLGAIASSVGAGAISSVSFARNFQSVPVTVIGISFALAAFPALSAAAAAGDRAAFTRILRPQRRDDRRDHGRCRRRPVPRQPPGDHRAAGWRPVHRRTRSTGRSWCWPYSAWRCRSRA